MLDAQTFNRYATDPAAFRADLIVDVDGVARRFGDVQDPWQMADFAALDPAWLRCTGRGNDETAKMRAYLERGRGHSKTTDLATMCCWALAFATRPLRGYVFACDRDQAALLRDAMAVVCRLNPWLAELLDVQKHSIENVGKKHPGAGARLDILTSDVGSSYGLLADWIISEELTHWPENADKLWHSILSTAAKRSNCVLLTISNAGFIDSWQWAVREAARTDPGWIFSRLEGPQASWLTPDRLDEQRRMLPTVAFERLWGNHWSTGGGDALTEADINAAFKDHLKPLPPQSEFNGHSREETVGWDFVAGLDLGVSRDASAICVLGVRRRGTWEHDISDHGRIRLAYTRVWLPARGKKVNLSDVEGALLTLHREYQFKAVNFDPWQATHMSQRLMLSHMPMNEITPTGQNLQRQATTLIEAFADRRVDLYPEPDLKRDLRRLRIEERSYGFRLASPRDATGHGDLASAFALAMLAASERASRMTRMATFDFDDHRGTTWEDRQREYQEEMQRLAAGGSDDSREILEQFMGLVRSERSANGPLNI